MRTFIHVKDEKIELLDQSYIFDREQSVDIQVHGQEISYQIISVKMVLIREGNNADLEQHVYLT